MVCEYDVGYCTMLVICVGGESMYEDLGIGIEWGIDPFETSRLQRGGGGALFRHAFVSK